MQDIPSQVKDAIQHTQKVARSLDSHWVNIVEKSRLHQILGSERVRVNSLHHQAIDRVADDLRVVAEASDGVIEAVEYIHPTKFTIGVQWHPESLASSNEMMNRLFNEFVQAAQ